MTPRGGADRELLVENIGELLTIPSTARDADAGRPGARLGIVHDASVAVKAGRVVYAGPARGLPDELRALPRVDAGGALCTPALVEPHAHPVFAGSRAREFDLRARGATYLEIQAAGGGIRSSVLATRAASDQELVDGTLARLDRFLANGVTVVESKSGYDLTIEGELRLLRVLAEVRRRHVVDLSPTLLAHVPPLDGDRAEFVRRFTDEAIPTAQREGLAEAVDVYCDTGAFTLDEARTILTAGQRAGLLLRAHAEQFTHTGVAELAAQLGARSVEHLEQLGESAPALLARAGTVCNLLPGAALTLRLPWPDARALLDAGCRVALGTDCNPGSSLTESLPLMMSLACMQLRMSCEEAWLGVTREAAHAVNRPDAGHLQPGARGDLIIWDASDHQEVVQHFGVPLVRTVFVAGQEAWARNR